MDGEETPYKYKATQLSDSQSRERGKGKEGEREERGGRGFRGGGRGGRGHTQVGVFI